MALPLTAVLAASALRRERDRVAGIFLLVSAATPTYFFWPVNLPALITGRVAGHPRASEPSKGPGSFWFGKFGACHMTVLATGR